MKTVKNSIRFSRSFSVALFTLAFLSLLFVSCVKEKLVEVEVVNTLRDTIEVPVVTTVTNTCNRPHEVEDLVAWYSPFSNVFLIDPDYLENVLLTLQAKPNNAGGFTMNGINLKGEPRLVNFHIKLVESPAIYATATATAEASLTPELIQTFTEKGTSYKVYKNAECGKVQKGFESACENQPGGTSEKRIWYDIRRCERGNGFCTEALSVQGRSVTYHNANCQGPVKSETSLHGYACWQ